MNKIIPFSSTIVVLFILAFFLNPKEVKAQGNCGCDHVIAPGDLYIDGNALNIQPGDVVCVTASTKPYLGFINFNGAPGNPIIIKNCGGQVIVQNTDWYYGVKFDKSSYFHFTGTGSASHTYGFLINGTPAQIPGLAIGMRSTDFEVDHIEVANAGFAGIMAKSDPDCAGAPNRGNFVQRNTSIHDNYVHHTSAEGIYVGFPHYRGVPRFCAGDTIHVYPHDVEGVRIFNNKIESTGREGIQVGCAISDVEIYQNEINGFGVADGKWQRAGVHLSTGTTGKFYNNKILNGTGPGIWLNAYGDNFIFNNIIYNVGSSGEDALMIHDSLVADGKGYHIINNTIVNSRGYGYKVYTDRNTILEVINNIVTGTNDYNSVPASAQLKDNNNVWDPNPDNIRFENYGMGDYHLKAISPAVDAGMDVASYGVMVDCENVSRPLGKSYDAGAFESEFEREEEGFFIYPNPIHTVAHISFVLPEDVEDASLKVYDTHGREVAIIARGPFKSSTKYEYVFDSFFLAQGVYYYTLQTNDDVKVIKILLVE